MGIWKCVKVCKPKKHHCHKPKKVKDCHKPKHDCHKPKCGNDQESFKEVKFCEVKPPCLPPPCGFGDVSA